VLSAPRALAADVKSDEVINPNASLSYDNEKPVHEVKLTRGLWLGQMPVTEAAYSRFLKATGEARYDRVQLSRCRSQ